MPKLPSDDQIIDLRLSKHSNTHRVLTGGVISQLEKLSLGDRASVILHSLTDEHSQQLDEAIIVNKQLMRTIRVFLNSQEPEAYGTRFDDDKGILFLNGKEISFKEGDKMRGLLAAIFSDRINLSSQIPYKDFLSDNRNILDAYDITETSQIASLKRHINDKIPEHDLLNSPRYLTVNLKYL